MDGLKDEWMDVWMEEQPERGMNDWICGCIESYGWKGLFFHSTSTSFVNRIESHKKPIGS